MGPFYIEASKVVLQYISRYCDLITWWLRSGWKLTC